MGTGRRKRWSRFFLRSEPQPLWGASLNLSPDQTRAFSLTKKNVQTKAAPCTYLSDDDSNFVIVHTVKPSVQPEDEPTPRPYSRESSALSCFGGGSASSCQGAYSSETSPTAAEFTSVGKDLGVAGRIVDRRVTSLVDPSESGCMRLSRAENQDEPHSPTIPISSPPSSFRRVKCKGARLPTPPAPCRHSPSCSSLSPETCGPLRTAHHLSKLKDKVDIDLTLPPPGRRQDSACLPRIITSAHDQGDPSPVTPTTQPSPTAPALPPKPSMRSISLCPVALYNDTTAPPHPVHPAAKLVKRRPSTASVHREPEKQKTLPPVRAQSPFRVSLPHGQSSPPNGNHQRVPPMTRPNARPVSITTDALASLAWIGTPPLSPASPPPPYSSSHFVCGLGTSIPVHDESLTDDVLVERLEKYRKEASASRRPSRTRLLQGPVRTNTITSQASSNSSEASSSSLGCPPPPPVPPLPPMYMTSQNLGPGSFDSGHDVELEEEEEEDTDPEDTAIWFSARKALLCVREIVRTERTYQDALRALLRGDTLTPPPESMLAHLPPLIRASENLLRGMMGDPSAWGVSTAFMSAEDEIEDALVVWSAVAGEFFQNDSEARETKKVLRRSMPPPVSRSSGSRKSLVGWKSQEQHTQPVGELPSVPTLSELMNGAGGSKRQHPGIQCLWSSSTAIKPECESRSDQHGEESSRKKNCGGAMERSGSTKASSRAPVAETARKFSVRDLAIQPTQRVMRYVLLYRDLLESTPQSSPSRALVERALEAAKRIAGKCDRAQSHSAFLYGNSRNPARRGSS